MTEFKRETRYVVVKISDLADARLTDQQVAAFNDVCDQVARSRNANGKAPLQCVVVESDWPEYEPTWTAIEKRMLGDSVDTHSYCLCGSQRRRKLYTTTCLICGKKCDAQ